jgi:hypothetical protein
MMDWYGAANRSGIRIFEISAKTGTGMEEWLGYLAEARAGQSRTSDLSDLNHPKPTPNPA